MYPAKPNVKEIVKGSGFRKISFNEILKQNELIRTVPAK